MPGAMVGVGGVIAMESITEDLLAAGKSRFFTLQPGTEASIIMSAATARKIQDLFLMDAFT